MTIVAMGLLGPTLDSGRNAQRWERWRPSVALCQHEDLLIARFELLHQPRYARLAQGIRSDIGRISPETEVRLHAIDCDDAWDLEEMYGALHDFATGYRFRAEREDYLVHITTGTHIAQICLYLLTESRHFPAQLIQTSPPDRRRSGGPGTFQVIDLDLSKYDRIASRFRKEQRARLSYLKSGIDTRNARFNALIEEIEQVAIHSRDPLLLTGPTGAGKSRLARRIYELKRERGQLKGGFVDVNCATLRGEQAMSALFGHVKGAFTGALSDRPGLLRSADGGVLFLDEIGELGADEQAMLLRAVEEKVFYPMGSDKEARSDFQLIAGTNRELRDEVLTGRFREDLLSRIHLWTFRLPPLRERPEDIAPNLDFEILQASQALNVNLRFSREARERFLAFARSPDASWSGNFRDLNAAVRRMATLSKGGRITPGEVDTETKRLRASWRSPGTTGRFAELDLFDRVQLEAVLEVCARSQSLSDAGRKLFARSRLAKSMANDADRLRKYLARFGLSWRDVRSGAR